MFSNFIQAGGLQALLYAVRHSETARQLGLLASNIEKVHNSRESRDIALWNEAKKAMLKEKRVKGK